MHGHAQRPGQGAHAALGCRHGTYSAQVWRQGRATQIVARGGLAHAVAAAALLLLAACPIPRAPASVLPRTQDAAAAVGSSEPHHHQHCTPDILLENVYMVTLATSAERLAHARRVAEEQRVHIKFWPGVNGMDLDHERLKQEAAAIRHHHKVLKRQLPHSSCPLACLTGRPPVSVSHSRSCASAPAPARAAQPCRAARGQARPANRKKCTLAALTFCGSHARLPLSHTHARHKHKHTFRGRIRVCDFVVAPEHLRHADTQQHLVRNCARERRKSPPFAV